MKKIQETLKNEREISHTQLKNTEQIKQNIVQIIRPFLENPTKNLKKDLESFTEKILQTKHNLESTLPLETAKKKLLQETQQQKQTELSKIEQEKHILDLKLKEDLKQLSLLEEAKKNHDKNYSELEKQISQREREITQQETEKGKLDKSIEMKKQILERKNQTQNEMKERLEKERQLVLATDQHIEKLLAEKNDLLGLREKIEKMKFRMTLGIGVSSVYFISLLIQGILAKKK